MTVIRFRLEDRINVSRLNTKPSPVTYLWLARHLRRSRELRRQEKRKRILAMLAQTASADQLHTPNKSD